MNKRKIKEMINRVKDKTLDIKEEVEKSFKIRDARDRKIFYSVIAVVFLILVYLIFVRGYFTKQEQKKVAEEKARTEQIRQERIEKIEKAPKSRISFFLAGPVKANLAMPDYWEGNYRLKETQEKASFIYIEEASQPAEIFYIKVLPDTEIKNLEKGEQEIEVGKRVVKNNISYAFVFKMSDENPYKDNELLKAKFDRMKIDAMEMIKMYFKTF